jgi:hypothetical protein
LSCPDEYIINLIVINKNLIKKLYTIKIKIIDEGSEMQKSGESGSQKSGASGSESLDSEWILVGSEKGNERTEGDKSGFESFLREWVNIPYEENNDGRVVTDEDEVEGFLQVNDNNKDDPYSWLYGRTKLSLTELKHFKSCLDSEINQSPIASVKNDSFPSKTDIPISIEKIGTQILVKVGPWNLGNVGGDKRRKAIIENLVNEALKKEGYNDSFDNVYVSACIGVRGRVQMAKQMAQPVISFFSRKPSGQEVDTDYNAMPGGHMNAYIKSPKEPLTHLEPRNGPQPFFNDTICSLVVGVITWCFEKLVREGKQPSRKDIQEIFTSKELCTIFDTYLKSKEKERIKELVSRVKQIPQNWLKKNSEDGKSPSYWY